MQNFSPVSSKSSELLHFFACQCDAKSQFYNIFKSGNLAQILRFRPKFLQSAPKYTNKQMLYSNIGLENPPSLIS